MRALRIGLLGLGTVGAGTVRVLQRNQAEIQCRAGRELKVVSASARDLTRKRACSTQGIRLQADSAAVVTDPEVDVVVELIGGLEPARRLVLTAIEHGKHIVTANKALIAVHGNELFQQARRHGVIVSFEAAVAGGVPIIKAMREGLAGNRISFLAGIINGTTNFILSSMDAGHGDLAHVLRQAQDLGYAEADPSFDIKGTDAAHKLTILASLAFGIPLQFEQVCIEGIQDLSLTDIHYARELGYRIKHLGIARRRPDGIELRVHTTLIPQRHLLASVNGVMNAVLIQGDAVGPTLYCGAGAGAEPTASAVIADLVDISRACDDAATHVPSLAFQPGRLADTPVLPASRMASADYLRMWVVDQPGVLASISGILGEMDISIEAVLQKEPGSRQGYVTLIMLTQCVRESNLKQALERIQRLDVIDGKINRIRVEDLA